MPTSSKSEPRSYVRQYPLPIPSHQGVKIQARSREVYSATIPTRDEVRRDNHIRRTDQLTCRGFSAFNYIPYKGIGDPFYLDEKRLILSALGQWNDNYADDSFSSSDDDSIYLDSRSSKRPESPRKFVYKARMNQSKLHNEVKNGRTMIRNVRLGQSYFHTLDKQRLQRQLDREEEERLKKEHAMANWQPPTIDSDSESEKEDFMKDAIPLQVSLSTRDVPTPVPSQTKSFRRSVSSKLALKRASCRPFTPIHSSLLGEEAHSVERSALFRQLCALHWVLEAMNSDGAFTMAPILMSWNLNEIGGQKVSPRKVVSEKMTENAWTTFQTTPVSQGHKRGSTVMFSVFAASKKWRRAPRRLSIKSPRGSIDSTASGMMPGRPVSAPKSLSDASVHDGDDDDEIVNKSLFRFLDEYYESLKPKEESGTETKNGAAPEAQNIDSKPNTASSGKQRSDEERALRRVRRGHDRPSRSAGTGDESVQSLRTGPPIIRPRSSPALVEFQASAFSTKYGTLSQDMQREFSSLQEEKEMDLWDSLENHDRSRDKNCRTKFTSLPMSGSITPFKALRSMRQSTEDLKKLEREKNLSDQSPWFTELKSWLPESAKNVWYFHEILEKLSIFAESGKFSCSKFLRAIGTLRNWEICSPDVAAAIEFCRVKIMEMSVEDYEKWFQEHHPNVERASVPPGSAQFEKLSGHSISGQSTRSLSRSRPKTTSSIRSQYA